MQTVAIASARSRVFTIPPSVGRTRTGWRAVRSRRWPRTTLRVRLRVGRPEVREARRVVGVRTDAVLGDATVGHDSELGVDDVVGQLAPVEERSRLARVVGE